MRPKFVGLVLELRPLYGRPNYVLAVGATLFGAQIENRDRPLPKVNEKPGIPLPLAPALMPNFTEMLIQLVDLEPRLLLLTCMRKASFPRNRAAILEAVAADRDATSMARAAATAIAASAGILLS